MTLYFTSFSTPLGDFAAAVDHTGAVVVTAFTADLSESPIDRRKEAPPPDVASTLRRRLRTESPIEFVRDDDRTAIVRDQVLAYAHGERDHFDVPLRPFGSSFEKKVWAELRRIPVGETRTYAELADNLDSAPRAIGGANARNPICLLVPCHRVIGKDGTLTGFAFGVALKQRLLDHERLLATAGV